MNTLSRTNRVINAPTRWILFAIFAIAVALMATDPVFCLKVKDVSMDTLFGSIVEIILKIAYYVGALITVSGVVSLIMAYKDDNADGQTRAVRLVVVGIVLIGMKALLTGIGLLE